MKNLLLEDSMPEDLVKKYIVAFTSIRELYSSCCRKKLDPNHRSVTNKFKNARLPLVKDPRIKLSIPNKCYFIINNFSDYFEDPLTGGEGLGKTTD